MSFATDNKGLYLYCLIPKNVQIELEQTGIDKEHLFTIEYKDILAIVSSSPYKVHDITPENLFTHEGVIREIMDKADVLPFNFGNVMKSREDLIKFLDGTYTHIQKIFKKISGRIELGLKAFIKNERFNEEIENSEIKRLKKLIANMDEKKAFSLKVELGRLVKSSLERKQSEYEEKILNLLKQYCADAKSNNCSTVKMILNAAFLIDKNTQTYFDEKVNEIIEQYEDILEFKYTGPWPPYNFVDMPK